MSASVFRLSHLLELRVEDEHGHALGHIHDVRVRQVSRATATEPPAYHVDSLIIGRRGVGVRLGWRRDPANDPPPPGDVVAWDDVLSIEPERLIVRHRDDARQRDRS